MAIRTIFKYRGPDSTKDFNDRWAKLFAKGVYEGGALTPVPTQLKVDVAPFRMVAADGMAVLEETLVTRLDIPAGQTSYVCLRAQYIDNADPIVQWEVLEETVFLADLAPDTLVVFAKITLSGLATEVLTGDIDLRENDVLDQHGRDPFRGAVDLLGDLPSSALFNRDGDTYIVRDNGLGVPTVVTWASGMWNDMTAALAIGADLTNHRNNLFTDEKHMTDDEDDALANASNPLSAANPVVDEANTRLPTQDENDALVGSHGTPSAANAYVTQDFPYARPTEISSASAPVGAIALTTAGNGPVFVGTSVTGTAQDYFELYDYADDRGLLNSAGLAVHVTGIFKDAGLTIEIDPSTDADVDADGFYNGLTSLYIETDNVIDTGYTLSYGRRNTLGSWNTRDFLLRSPQDIQVSQDVLNKFYQITDDAFDTAVPANQTLPALRADIGSVSTYVSGALDGDIVVGRDDYRRLNENSTFTADFEENVGITDEVFTFTNAGLNTYTYDGTTGVIQYAGTPALGAVVPGHTFIDGADREFRIVGINAGAYNLTIRPAQLVVTAVATSRSGSIKKTTNPRNINYSTMLPFHGRKRFTADTVDLILDEYDYNGRPAYRIAEPTRHDEVRLYGGWQSASVGAAKYAINTDAGSLSVTDYMTDCVLLVELADTLAPVLYVYIDGEYTATVDPTRSGAISNVHQNQKYDVQQPLVVASGLTPGLHTIEVVINTVGTSALKLYGVDVYNNVDVVRESTGRAFLDASLVKFDTLNDAAYPASINNRGEKITRYLDRLSQTRQWSQGVLTSIETNGTTNTTTIISAVAPAPEFHVGDYIRVTDGASVDYQRVQLTTASTLTVTPASTFSDAAADIEFLFSTLINGENGEETAYTRMSPFDFESERSDDFSILDGVTPQDAHFTLDDNVTTLVGKQVTKQTSNLQGVDEALRADANDSAVIRFTFEGTRCDILTANTAVASCLVKIDDYPAYTWSVGVGLSRYTLIGRAAYGVHTVEITPQGTDYVDIAYIETQEITRPYTDGFPLYTAHTYADYRFDDLITGLSVSRGVKAISPRRGFIYEEGTGGTTSWLQNVNIDLTPKFGVYYRTDRTDAVAEFYIQGTGFELEYLGMPDQCIVEILVNDANCNNVTFPTVTFQGADFTPATGLLDQYQASNTIRKMSAVGFDEGIYKITVKTTGTKNAGSSDFFCNIVAAYEVTRLSGHKVEIPYNQFASNGTFIDERPVTSRRNIVESTAVVAGDAPTPTSTIELFSTVAGTDQYNGVTPFEPNTSQLRVYLSGARLIQNIDYIEVPDTFNPGIYNGIQFKVGPGLRYETTADIPTRTDNLMFEIVEIEALGSPPALPSTNTVEVLQNGATEVANANKIDFITESDTDVIKDVGGQRVEVHLPVEEIQLTNDSGGALTQDDPVYIKEINAAVDLTDITDNTNDFESADMLGVVTVGNTNGNPVKIKFRGVIKDFGVRKGFANGKRIWLDSAAGTYTDTKPVLPTVAKIFVGYIANDDLILNIQDRS